MPHPDDTATRLAKRKVVIGDWRSDWKRITGEEFSYRSFAERTHEDDVAGVVRELVRGHTTGKLDVVYRVRNADGNYCRIHGVGVLMFDEWTGYIDCLGKDDCESTVSWFRLLYFPK